MLEYKPIWRVPGTGLRSNSLHLQFTIFLQRHESSWLSTYMAKNHQNDYLYRNNAPLSKIITRPWLGSIHFGFFVFFSLISPKKPKFPSHLSLLPYFPCRILGFLVIMASAVGAGQAESFMVHHRVVNGFGGFCVEVAAQDHRATTRVCGYEIKQIFAWNTRVMIMIDLPTTNTQLWTRTSPLENMILVFFFNREPRCFSLFILMQRYREMIKNPFHFTKIVKRPDVSSDNAQWGGVVLKPN